MTEIVPGTNGSGLLLSRLNAFRPLTPAEMDVAAKLQAGDFDRLGDGRRPEGDDPARTVRAEVLRFLILGEGGYPSHQKGLRIRGAWIGGVLDLEGCRVLHEIRLEDCHFEKTPVFRSAVVDSVFLDGSLLPGVKGERLEARGCLSLKSATIDGPIRLSGSRIGASIEADGARISAPGENALDASSLEARGSILLRGAEISGGLNLSSARLGGGVNLVGATIERPDEVAFNGDALVIEGELALRGTTIVGESRLVSGRCGGDVDCSSATFSHPDGFGLRLNHTVIEGAFLLRHGARVDGVLDLTAATIGAIYDERESWPRKGDLLLNRCQYGALIGGPVDAKARLDWLARQTPARWDADFWPQPYSQLAAVFGEMGYEDESRSVLITKERLQRRARRRRTSNPFLRLALTTRDGILSITVRYGRQPLFALVWIFLFWSVGSIVFGISFASGAMKPNSPVILRSAEWTMCGLLRADQSSNPSVVQMGGGRADAGVNQLTCFLDQVEASSYPEFNALMYSLDVLLPVLSIGQKEYWRPDSLKPGGTFALRYYFFQSVIGWALGLLAVAGFSGLVKSK
jgi:hypothetical protein